MSHPAINFLIKFVLLILAQAVIFNNIVLYGTAMAFVFIYIIVSCPVTWSTNSSLTIGFLAGLAVDIFSNTLGINALSCTILAFLQKPVIHLYIQHDDDLAGQKPCQRTMGAIAFAKYMITMAVIYCLLVFTIDAFAIFSFPRYCQQVLGSSLFTAVMLYAFDSISTRKHEKRL